MATPAQTLKQTLAIVGTALVVAACTGDDFDHVGADLGGAATVQDASASAFALPIPSLSSEDRRAFFVGNSFFNDNWVTAPASTEGRDGLGPVFNARSCSSCHFKDGRGLPPDEDPTALGLLIRLSVVDENGDVLPEPTYGDQLQDRSIGGVDAEGTIMISYREHLVTLADGSTERLALPEYAVGELAHGALTDGTLLSPRLANQLPGVGLLEAVPEATIVAAADPDDADGDGISGRANYVEDVATGELELGRFGWKANAPSVEQQTAAAFVGDIGITSSLFPYQPCTDTDSACVAAPAGGEPELDDHKLERVTFYARTLAVPARRNPDDPQVMRGEQLFTEVGCAACHTPTLTTSETDIEQLSGQTIHPFTDLLVHDMGPGLADGRPDGLAGPSEWRTAPLWGLGLIPTVNGEARYLHDGRARTLNEAILWHDGEARASRDAYTALPGEDVAALVAFLEDL